MALGDDVIRAAAEGSSADRDRIFASMEPQVRSMVIVRLAARRDQVHSVDEIAQHALIAITEGLPRLRSMTVQALKSFASTVVANKVADHLRTPRREFASLDSTIGSGSDGFRRIDLLPGSDLSPRSAVAKAEELHQMVAQMGGLKQNYADVITLAFFDQLSLDEVGERMGITGAAASMLLVRAIRSLKERMLGGNGGLDHGDSQR